MIESLRDTLEDVKYITENDINYNYSYVMPPSTLSNVVPPSSQDIKIVG